MELRMLSTEIETRETEEGFNRVAGLGIVYDKEEELFPGYKEKIRKDAFRDSIQKQRNRPIKSYVNHDPNQVLATTASNPPLVLQNREDGVFYEAEIPETSYGDDLKVNLQRKNVEGSSFAFNILEDDWHEDEEGIVHREVIKGEIFEIGPVTDPAFLNTPTNLRDSKEAYESYQAQASKDNGSKLDIMRKKLELKEKGMV